MIKTTLPTEIEAKFLVRTLPPSLDSFPHSPVKQGYVIATENESMRLRQKSEAYFLTVKRGQGLTRTEVEILLTAPQFLSLWPLTENHQLTKTRYYIPLENSLTAELDLYHGSLEGLATVEVEFPDESSYRSFAKNNIPRWFGKEVTSDARYLNQSLAFHGIPVDECL